MTTRPIPDGFHTLTPFFNLKDAAKAIEFYQQAFGAELVSRVDMPNGLVGHAHIRIGNSNVFIEEAVRNPATKSSMLVYTENADAAFKRATDAGAKEVMPLANQFWGDRWGMVEDAWGNRWGIATHIEDVSPDELARRAAAARG